ncbi:MAG: thioredoxin family protein [Planctomycetaceae bacterium]|nr:thioredoxin family protein [Planctomycetaceae bacterium]
MNTPPEKYCLGFPALTALFLVFFLTVSSLANPIPPIQVVRWETDLSVATLRAGREQRPLFLHFVSNDNPASPQTGSEVFTHPNIAAHLNANYVMVRINAVENPTLGQQLGVTAVPSDLILKPNGQEIHRRVGVITTERFAEYLTYLQKLQSEATQAPAAPPAAPGAFPAMNPQSSIQPGPPPTATMPIASPPQQDMSSVARDPFAPQTSVAQSPLFGQPSQPPPTFAAGVVSEMPSPPQTPVNNPLRGFEMSARPVPPQNAPIAPPPAATMQAMLEVPAPPKMTVEVPLALEGFCPVVLCTEERWVAGNPAYCTMYQGHIFRFSSAEALVTFSKNPVNFTPVAMGEDIVLTVDRNRRVNGNREIGAWFHGRVFLFSSQETFAAFETRPEYYAEIALKYEIARRELPAPVVY